MKQSDIERIAAAGLITPEQQAAIIEHFRLGAGRHRRWLLLSLCGLAGALILAGIIMLVSANWEQIPDLVKMGTGMALLVAFWAAWAGLRNSRPVVAEMCGFLGAGMWLADIALYGQIFRLQNPFVEGVFLFFCGVAAIPFLVRQRLLIAAVAVTSFVLLTATFDTTAAESWLSFRGLCESLPRLTEKISVSECQLIALWVLTVFWWLLAELWATRGGSLFRSYAWLSIPATLFMNGIIALFLILRQEAGTPEAFTLTSGLTAAGCTLLLLLLMRPKHPLAAWLLPAALAVAAPLLLTCVELPPLASVVVIFAYGVLMMTAGSLALRVLWVNVGSLLIAVAALRLFADVLDSYTASGLTLIAGGVVLLFGALVLEKQRRRLVAGMATSQPQISSDHE